MSKIITAADLNAYTGKTLNSGQAALVVAAVNKWVENETKRVWGEIQTFTERYDWAPILWLRHTDVLSITSIKLGYPGQPQSVVPAGDMFWTPRGRVTMYLAKAFNPSVVNNDLVEVVYKSAYTDEGYSDPNTNLLPNVPDDLKLAALGLAADYYNYTVNEQHDITMSMVGQYRLAFSKDTDKYASIIKSYKLRRL